MGEQKPREVTVPETTANEMPPPDNSPAALMALALSKGMDLDKLEKFMNLQERYEAKQALKSYTVAMSTFKTEKLTIIKDKTNLQYKSKYSSEDSLLNTINPMLSKHELSASYDFDQTNGIKVTCIITHSAGHREQVSLIGPPDASGSKNPLQQIKSTITYLRKATFEAITGIASSDEAGDDDGGSVEEKISDEHKSTILDFINSKEIDQSKFLLYLGADSIDNIPDKDYPRALVAVKAAKGSGMWQRA